ncbi:CHAD domain-containing protein [Acidicapsa dinghuensis]|uniref:CHAD domain-containing protein n=1 Tax=Acidicapsa dinghuensis TaxID=2218256 RepID=A0ABW1EPM4_9BACT|nr:CHAD domain-containing protein [Acidicapsa dinghuensis]
MQSLLTHWPKKPSADDVHSLRTTSRRLEALTKFLRLQGKTKAYKTWRSAHILRKSAGKARDLDVLTKLVETLRKRRRNVSCGRLMDSIQELRPAAVAALNDKVHKHQDRLVRRLTWQRHQILEAGTDDSLNQYAADWERTLHKQVSKLASVEKVEQANAHQFRIRAKKLRDMLALCDDARKDTLRKLGSVKDLLGEWHDWQELEKLATEVLRSPSDRVFKGQLQRLTNDKLKAALGSANQLCGLDREDLFGRNAGGQTHV